MWQLHPTFAAGMKVQIYITPKRLFLNIKQRDKFSN
jgi:hypothetical protein